MALEGEVLWAPDGQRREQSHVAAFTRWLQRERGLEFISYEDLWQWSVQDIELFWECIWDYFQVRASIPFTRVLGRREMPGAEWFPGARLNYAEHALAHERPGVDALLYVREGVPLARMSWSDLGAQVRIVATRLRRLGVVPGDRVVGVLPNCPQAVVAVLATTSIGAIWSCCGPDFGPTGVLERFSQLAPKVIFYVDGYRYGGKPFDRKEEMRQILARLNHPGIARVFEVGRGDECQHARRCVDRELRGVGTATDGIRQRAVVGIGRRDAHHNLLFRLIR